MHAVVVEKVGVAVDAVRDRADRLTGRALAVREQLLEMTLEPLDAVAACELAHPALTDPARGELGLEIVGVPNSTCVGSGSSWGRFAILP